MELRESGKIAYYHLPGLFEFYDLYRIFLRLFREHRDWFYDWCDIGSIYGAPADCLWGGGRVGFGDADPEAVASLMQEYGISARLTFSNSLLTEEHLEDKRCRYLCSLFEKASRAIEHKTSDFPGVCGEKGDSENAGGNKEDCNKEESDKVGSNKTGRDESEREACQNGVIVHSDLLADFLGKTYPGLYLVSSTTKVLTDFSDFLAETDRPKFRAVVPDFRLNRAFDNLAKMTPQQKKKTEFLCNECCYVGCTDRRACYENVSRKSLGEACEDHICRAPGGDEGYRFSKAMQNPSFIGIGDITERYLPMGFSDFKIEGRGLGSAMVLEFLLYYMAKPEAQLLVREEIYLDSMLDLF